MSATRRKRNRVEIMPGFPSGERYRLIVNGEQACTISRCAVAGGYVCHYIDGAFGSLEKLRQAVLKDLRR